MEKTGELQLLQGQGPAGAMVNVSLPSGWGSIQGLWPACRVTAVCSWLQHLSPFCLNKGSEQDQQGITAHT